jgi:hypothetical protein
MFQSSDVGGRTPAQLGPLHPHKYIDKKKKSNIISHYSIIITFKNSLAALKIIGVGSIIKDKGKGKDSPRHSSGG